MSRKWREYTAVLTGSRLLLFRDSTRAKNFLEQARSNLHQSPGTVVAALRPDDRLSLKDAIAVVDSSYKKVR